MIHITYKIVNEYDAHRSEGTVYVYRKLGDDIWRVVPNGSPRRLSFGCEKDARSAIEKQIKADKAAATRLGIPFAAKLEE